MKKNYLFGMALMASLSFYSCTNEIIYVQDGIGTEEVTDGGQYITLQVQNSGDGLVTRAGRPLYSAEAKQSIENVKLWICDGDDNVVFVKEISDWNTEGSTAYTTNGHGRQTTIELTGVDKLEAGTYKVYAVGYSNESAYDLEAVTNVTKSSSFTENIKLPVNSEKVATVNGEEIFAGQLDLTVENKKGFKTPIILNRQVAGAFAYVKDIPCFEGKAKYLKLVASAKNKSLVLGKFNSFDLTGNGSGNEGHINYVVNGTDAANDGDYKYEISKVDLSEWFTSIQDTDGDGLIDVDGNWKNGIDTKSDGSKETTFQKGSVFGGQFVIPFAKVDGYQTLTLVLTDESGTELRSWKVNLASGDINTAYYWDGTDWDSQTSGESVNSYSLVRNHLYGIGTRMEDNPGNGTDPDPDPEDPDDKPESLNNKQELVLKVNDNWEVIHGMELE